MAEHVALIVDDEEDIRELLAMTLERMDVGSCSAKDVAEARRLLMQNRFDLCLTDMRLPDGNGIDLVEHIQQNHPEVPVAVITAYGDAESAVRSLKAGAFDFVSKPVELEVLRNLVAGALRLSEKHKAPTRVLLGDSSQMQAIRGTIAKLARSQAPVYISGESGTGKELVARLIHEQGPRADQPFVPVNCGAIPHELIESEFFGHKKGSFTGASSDKPGLFQAAHGGTLFLDEVADLPLTMQVKLLRAIQEKGVRPVGAQHEVPIDVRVLSATHKDLSKLVAEGKFRQDLYYRINVIELRVSSLRERPGDIPQLVEHVLTQRMAPDVRILLSDAAMQALMQYDFPGNVRELENILERALTLCEGDTLQESDLHLPVHASTPLAAPAAQEVKQSLDPYLYAIEREAILKALEQTRYNKTAAARLLGISFRALRYRLKKLGVD
jgi:two-component system response regulator PilR (NtrC family)